MCCPGLCDVLARLNRGVETGRVLKTLKVHPNSPSMCLRSQRDEQRCIASCGKEMSLIARTNCFVMRPPNITGNELLDSRKSVMIALTYVRLLFEAM